MRRLAAPSLQGQPVVASSVCDSGQAVFESDSGAALIRRLDILIDRSPVWKNGRVQRPFRTRGKLGVLSDTSKFCTREVSEQGQRLDFLIVRLNFALFCFLGCKFLDAVPGNFAVRQYSLLIAYVGSRSLFWS